VLALVLTVFADQQNSASANKAAEKKQYVIGLLPFMSPIALFKRFSPLRAYLNEDTNSEFVLESAKNFTQHITQINNRKYDFVLTAPHFVIPAVESKKYKVIASYTKPLSAVIVVHKNSKYKHISDLDGQLIATPPPKAIITIIGIKLFEDNKFDLSKVNYRNFSSHNAAYHAVLGGEVKAAVIAIFVYDGAIKKGAPLKIISKSYNFPAVGILAANDLPNEIIEDFQKSLIKMTSNKKGVKILKKMAFPGYKSATLKDYESLRYIVIPKATHNPHVIKK